MALELHGGKQWLYCHMKNVFLEHNHRGNYYNINYRGCFVYFILILKAQTILLCPHLPLLYSADHLSWLPMVAWQQSVFQILMRVTYLVQQGKEGKLLNAWLSMSPAVWVTKEAELSTASNGSCLRQHITQDSCCSPEITTAAVLRWAFQIKLYGKGTWSLPDFQAACSFSPQTEPGSDSDQMTCICLTASCITLGCSAAACPTTADHRHYLLGAIFPLEAVAHYLIKRNTLQSQKLF